MVEAIQGVLPIAEIPFIQNKQDQARRRRMRWAAMVGAPAVLVLLALAIHFMAVPLDVLWYSTIRQLGM
jgi:hypothetical protein